MERDRLDYFLLSNTKGEEFRPNAGSIGRIAMGAVGSESCVFAPLGCLVPLSMKSRLAVAARVCIVRGL